MLTFARISASLRIPTFGIGAGPGCDGQVLVLHDLLGLCAGDFQPRFVKQFGQLAEAARAALSAYRDEVVAGTFPASEHSFTIADDEFEKL